jgi:hypothetical protein
MTVKTQGKKNYQKTTGKQRRKLPSTDRVIVPGTSTNREWRRKVGMR